MTSSAAELARIVEALLFLSPDPVPVGELIDACEVSEVQLRNALDVLCGGLRTRPPRSRPPRGRRRLHVRHRSRPRRTPARRLLARPKTPPLTPAQAETLAIVAYLQPVSRPEIARIRGVSSESGVQTLAERGLIEESGRSRFGAVIYRTTELFERLFGLSGPGGPPRRRRVRPDARGRRRAPRATAARRRAARGSLSLASLELSLLDGELAVVRLDAGAAAPRVGRTRGRPGIVSVTATGGRDVGRLRRRRRSRTASADLAGLAGPRRRRAARPLADRRARLDRRPARRGAGPDLRDLDVRHRLRPDPRRTGPRPRSRRCERPATGSVGRA